MGAGKLQEWEERPQGPLAAHAVRAALRHTGGQHGHSMDVLPRKARRGQADLAGLIEPEQQPHDGALAAAAAPHNGTAGACKADQGMRSSEGLSTQARILD